MNPAGKEQPAQSGNTREEQGSDRLQRFFSQVASAMSPAVWMLGAIALVSSALVLTRVRPVHNGPTGWLFSRVHEAAYVPLLEDWNARESAANHQVELKVLDLLALERRMLSGFLSGTPVADLIEVERAIAGRAFTGPLEDVGFVDLTDRLRDEGLLDSINQASFSPWTSRGRIFGLPHDVHPVLLGYRADIVEAAGIDVRTIETWDDFARVLAPLMSDRDKDGKPDRYLINFWPTNIPLIEVLVLQAGGTLFDADGRPSLDSEINAHVIARLATWVAGPNRIAVDAPEFSAAGHRLRLEGVVIAQLLPDWLAGGWKSEIPGLSGKVKLMPLPAWERGGRRTSVWGGTMLGIPKATPDFETSWRFAKHLYLSPALAEAFYRTTTIIPPVMSMWNLPVFDEPDAFFSGQPSGRMYISVAGDIPLRSSSPYNQLAVSRLGDALLSLVNHANRTGNFDPAALEPEARRLLAFAQSQVSAQVNRNVFLSEPGQ